MEPSVEIIPVDFFSDDISGKLCYPSPTEEQMEVLYRALHSSDDRNVIVAVSNHYSKSDLWLANIFTYPDMSGIEYVSFSRGSRIVESDFFTGGSRLIHRTVATNVRVFFPKNSIAAFNAKTYEEQVEQLGVDLVSGYIVTLGSDMHNLSKANMSMIYSDPQSFLDFDSDPYSEEILSVKIKRDGDNGISIYGYRFFEDNGIQKLMICSVEFDSSIGKLVASEKVYTVGGITDAPSDNKQYARKNGEWEEVDSQPLMVETTYSALKLLRDTRNLVPGMQYRITDYVTTTAASNTRSAGHAFDIIVTADDVNMLNENARAIQHKGDTYFTNSNLNAWELKYCLNNDTTRFDWADTINGKGVIYYMKDEFNNECPYDFKNIQFMVGAKSNAGTLDDVYYYTFSVANDMGDMTITDHSLNGAYCYGNSFKEYINLNKITLNIIVFRNTSNTNGCYSNTFGNNCFDNTFGEGCCNNIFRNECNNNTFGNDYIGNTFENYCTNNTFGDGCLYNTFGNNCRFNTFASDSTGTAGNYFYCNTLENGVQYCTIYNTSTASSSQQVKNYHIKSSVIGTSSSRKLIETTRNLAYDTTVALNSSGELKIYCEADLIA